MRYSTSVPHSMDYFDRLVQIAAIASIGAYLICEIYSLDVWWHVVIGEDILDRLSVPTSDRFAAAALGRHYHDSHWLYQVVLAVAHRIAGMVGVELVTVALWIVVLFYVYKSISRWVSPSTSYILLFLAAMASSERFIPRPEIVTYVMVAIFYNRLQEGRYKKPRDIILLAILQILWTNSHGLFVIGPFLAGCYWVAELVRRLRGNVSEFPLISRLLVVLIFVTLLTPYGISNWYYAFLLFTEVGPNAPRLLKTIDELRPTFGLAARSAPAFWFYITFLISIALTTILLLFRWRINSARLIITIGMFLASLAARRNMALFVLVAAPFLSENIRYLVPKQIKGYRPMIIVMATAMSLWGWYAISGNYYLMMQIPARFGLGATPSFFPHALPDFLKRIGFSGQVLTSNGLAGFYLYHSYPERLPLTDGRWEVYDQEIFYFIDSALVDPLVWQRLVSLYDIQGILLGHRSYEGKIILPKLRQDPKWRLIYYDHAASFWIRSDLPGISPAVSLLPDAKLPSTPQRIEDCWILSRFLRHMDSPELEIKNLQQALLFGQNTEMILEKIGSLQIKLGKLDDAEETFQRLISEYPNNVIAINELSLIAFNNGELKKATFLLLLGLKRHPDNLDLKANYSKIIDAMRQSTGKEQQ